ncbi:MAG: ribonuclease P protein component [Marinifilaceae bacterium]|jgi:ribonuclease P protein component|nr:ribonuclease P protein component [Marinifilaceae bacterium]
MRRKFSKDERLVSKKDIERLFEEGNSFVKYPFKLVWDYAYSEIKHEAQVGIVVPKRNFKLAVDRNKIKRLIREVYRYHKHKNLYSKLNDVNANIQLFIIYIGKETPDYQYLENKMYSSLKRLTSVILAEKDVK